MRQTNQGGSVLGFVIIGAVLTLLLVGGVYFVRQQIPEVNPDTTSGPTLAESSKAPDNKPEEKTVPQNNENQQRPADNKEVIEPEKKEKTEETAELPQTGPEVSAVLLLGILTFLAVSYLQSRRTLVRL